MKKLLTLISLLFFFFSVPASAHGPVRGKLTATIKIDAPADKIWDIIKNYDDMSWLPPVDTTSAKSGNKKGTIRVLTLKDGATITEELKKYNEDKMSYKYKITDISSVGVIEHAGKSEEIPALPVDNYQATITVKGEGNSSVVTWVATYYRAYVNNNPPPELNEDAADAAITEVLTLGLTNLAQQFDSGAQETDVSIKMRR